MDNQKQKLIKKESIIGIIGLGYVGLQLAIRFSESGYRVEGIDIDENKVISLNDGKSYLSHIEDNLILNSIESGFNASGDFNKIQSVDVIIICVPTPLGKHNDPDLKYVTNTLDFIDPHIKENQTLILESTTYPGTTDELIIPFIERKGYKIGKNFFVGYSPEREDPGNKHFNTKTTPKVVSGHTDKCLDIVKVNYDQIVDKTIAVSSTKAAEMTKVLENIHRSVNIGLVNELKIVANKMGIDIFEVINAAATKPFGFTPYFPGPGLGGHCIPIDPFYLTWKAKEFGLSTRFIELAGEINTLMPNYVVDAAINALNKKQKPINKSKILLLGIAYKKNIEDTRESPSIVIYNKLSDLGGEVSFSDPYVKEFIFDKKSNKQKNSIDLNKRSISSYDLIIILTDHDNFDYELILKESKLIIDTRGRFKKSKKIISA